MSISEKTARRIVELLTNGAKLHISKNSSPMMAGEGVTYLYEDGIFYSEQSWYDLREGEGYSNRNAIGGTGMILGRLMRMELSKDIQDFLSKHESESRSQNESADGEQRP